MSGSNVLICYFICKKINNSGIYGIKIVILRQTNEYDLKQHYYCFLLGKANSHSELQYLESRSKLVNASKKVRVWYTQKYQ